MAHKTNEASTKAGPGVHFGGEPGFRKPLSLQHQCEVDAPTAALWRHALGALHDFDTYRSLRLGEVADPAIVRDHQWQRKVGRAFETFLNSFDRLAS
jgi:hypothetical protein